MSASLLVPFVITISPHTTTIGRFRVSSLCNQLDDGAYRASVSIRSGQGSASTDRVLRLNGAFGSAADAHRHGFAEGLAWVAEATQGLTALPPAARAVPTCQLAAS